MTRTSLARRADTALLPFLIAPGLGFAAVVMSAVLSAAPLFRLAELLGDSGEALRSGLLTLIGQAWAWAVLPALSWGVSRAVRLRPWVTSLGGVGTGLLFVLMLTWISRGAEGLTREHPARLVILALTSVAGVWLTRMAISRAEAARRRTDEAARREAESKKGQYEAFAREAARLAELSEAREQERARTRADG